MPTGKCQLSRNGDRFAQESVTADNSALAMNGAWMKMKQHYDHDEMDEIEIDCWIE